MDPIHVFDRRWKCGASLTNNPRQLQQKPEPLMSLETGVVSLWPCTGSLFGVPVALPCPYLVGAGVGDVDDACSLLGLQVTDERGLERLRLTDHVLLVPAAGQGQQQAVIALHLQGKDMVREMLDEWVFPSHKSTILGENPNFKLLDVTMCTPEKL